MKIKQFDIFGGFEIEEIAPVTPPHKQKLVKRHQKDTVMKEKSHGADVAPETYSERAEALIRQIVGTVKGSDGKCAAIILFSEMEGDGGFRNTIAIEGGRLSIAQMIFNFLKECPDVIAYGDKLREALELMSELSDKDRRKDGMTEEI